MSNHYHIRAVLYGMITIALGAPVTMSADLTSYIRDTALQRYQENIDQGKSKACALDAALEYFNGASTAAFSMDPGGLDALYQKANLPFTNQFAAIVLDNTTNYPITISSNYYSGLTSRVETDTYNLPARSTGVFGVHAGHWYGIECRVAGNDNLKVKGGRGIKGGGLSASFGRVYGGILSIEDGKLRLMNACGLEELPL